MIQNIKNIISETWRHKRSIFFIYAVQLLLGLILGFRACAMFCENLGDSLILEHLAKGFDRTVFMDMLNNKDGLLDAVQFLALILLSVYMVLSIFLHAGLLSNIRRKEYGLKTFLKNGLKNFLPFLAIAFISILTTVLFAALIGIPFQKLVGDPLVTFSSEKPFVYWLLALFGILIIWLIFIWSWSVATRYHYIDGSSFLKSIKKGILLVVSKKFKLLALGLFLLFTTVILSILYYWLMGDRGAPNWFIVLLGIAIQQVFGFIRIMVRGFGYVAVDGEVT